MSEFNKARKEDLYHVALEMNLDVQPTMTVVTLRDKIKSSPSYEVDFVNSLVRNQITAREEEQCRLELENRQKVAELEQRKLELEEKRRAEELEFKKLEMNFELEKLKLQTQGQNNSSGAVGGNATGIISHPENKIDIQKLLPTFRPETDEVTLFLVLLERQLKLSKVPEHLWVSYLLSAVPSSISMLIARESEENASNFSHVKDLLLKRFKISAEKCRQLFFAHRKVKEITWRDYYFELRAYFENWLKELTITSFEALQDLIIADQMKRRVPVECKQHMLDDWENLNSPIDLAGKLDAYDTVRNNFPKRDSFVPQMRKEFSHKENNWKQSQLRKEDKSSSKFSNRRLETDIVCYGCGKLGFIKKKCPDCSPSVRKEHMQVHSLRLYSLNTTTVSAPNVPITICNKKVLVCADTGANHSIAGERMYKLFLKTGVALNPHIHEVTLADGITIARETLSATVPVEIEGRVFKTRFIILPNAKGNRTLLGMDFLHRANIVLDTANHTWYFSDKPQRKFNFVDEYVEENNTSVGGVAVSKYALRDDEGKNLNSEERQELNDLLKKYESCFQPGGDTTPYVEHRINTGDSAPSAVPPYRMIPYLKRFAHVSQSVKERVEIKQDQRKKYYDKNRRRLYFSPGEKVWVSLHPVSKASKEKTAKFMPKRDGPYIVLTQKSLVTYDIASLDNPTQRIGTYHVSALTPFQETDTTPVAPLRKRGRPKTKPPVSSPSRITETEGEVVTRKTPNSNNLLSRPTLYRRSKLSRDRT